MRLHIALVHYPVLDREGDTVTSAVTSVDIHDLARIALTFDAERAYMISPVTEQRELVEHVQQAWIHRGDAAKNTRGKAMKGLRTLPTVERVVEDIVQRTGKKPYVVSTSAKMPPNAQDFRAVADTLRNSDDPALILFGTGWGLSPEVHQKADATLKPIRANANYNHLPVRGAIAIVLDRLVEDPDETICEAN